MDLNRQLARAHRFVWQNTATIMSIIDMLHLRNRFPQLKNYNKDYAATSSKLIKYHNEYVTEISNPIFAISLELSAFIMILCNICKPKRILDLGSGFSSFIFRLYAMQTSSKPVILSVDGNKEWLNKTGLFLNRHNLPMDNLIVWNDFLEMNEEPFDLILYDLDDLDFRQESLVKILSFAHQNSTIILDDTNRVPYGPYARKIIRESNLSYYNLKHYTCDNIKRWSSLAIS